MVVKTRIPRFYVFLGLLLFSLGDDCPIGDKNLRKLSYPTNEEINRALTVRPGLSWGYYIKQQKSIRILVLGT